MQYAVSYVRYSSSLLHVHKGGRMKYMNFLDPSLLIVCPVSPKLCLIPALAILTALVSLTFLVPLWVPATVSAHYVLSPPSDLGCRFPLGYVVPSLTPAFNSVSLLTRLFLTQPLQLQTLTPQLSLFFLIFFSFVEKKWHLLICSPAVFSSNLFL